MKSIPTPLFLFIALVLITTHLVAQKSTYETISVYNTQNAMPFGKFFGMFTDQFHPGFEVGRGRIFSDAAKHEWFIELKFGYFFHRYVQHGIPIYLNFGYRYLVNNKFYAETALGAGYMHSIPATHKLKLNDRGDYVNDIGIGRSQATVSFNLGLGYTPNPEGATPLTITTGYQQRIQMPFVRSYVPLLPYNTFMIGLRRPVHH